MIDTGRMRELLRIAERLGVARVALVGDTEQLRPVDAGQPFRLLQKAGMQTAKMDEVLRQRDQAALSGDPQRRHALEAAGCLDRHDGAVCHSVRGAFPGLSALRPGNENARQAPYTDIRTYPVHAIGCPPRAALDFLAELPHLSPLPGDRCRAPPPARNPRWPALRRYLVEQRGLRDTLVDLCRELGLVHADRHGNPVFVRRNAAGEAAGIETLPDAAAQEPAARGGFWMSWEPDWPASVILAANALDVLSILSLHLVPAKRRGCAVVSTGVVTASIPKWIEAWNPRRIFCAYDATPPRSPVSRGASLPGRARPRCSAPAEVPNAGSPRADRRNCPGSRATGRCRARS